MGGQGEGGGFFPLLVYTDLYSYDRQGQAQAGFSTGRLATGYNAMLLLIPSRQSAAVSTSN